MQPDCRSAVVYLYVLSLMPAKVDLTQVLICERHEDFGVMRWDVVINGKKNAHRHNCN